MLTYRITVKGLVQGIGYRPFVAETAEICGVGGWVRNTDGKVTILVSGESPAVEDFLKKMKNDAPAGAFVEEFSCEEAAYQKFDGFSIVESDRTGECAGIPRIPADLPTCESCLRELRDPGNRRYRHPFISCTSCGPRYSILECLPYDRETITMKDFPMCETCSEEYRAPGNRRRHAQTIACPDCGPKLKFVEIAGGDSGDVIAGGTESQEDSVTGQDALDAAIRCLKSGGIVAVKDIGGYHLACTPFSEDSVAGLRLLKGREKKPFAVMFADVATVKDYCVVNEAEEKLLLSAARPIVLLKKKKNGAQLVENVCGTSPDIGAMLPCNPVQTMLLEELGPLIMTSANASGELLILNNEKMEAWMRGRQRDIPLAVLSHDRPILTPLDDSIVRVVCGRTQTFRRARGYVPETVPIPVKGSVFAAGGDLKSCFCYTGDGNAYLSQYLGDLADEACLRAYEHEKVRMKELFGFAPERVVCDLHPGYLSVRECGGLPDSRKAVQECAASGRSESAWKCAVPGKNESVREGGLAEGAVAGNGELLRIQHHEAHVASVIAEHGLRGNVLGFAYDGTGYGRDKTIWGSEAFLWDGDKMNRVAHLKPVRLIGGDEGAKNADTILYGYMASFGAETRERIFQAKTHFPWMEESRAGLVEAAVHHGINTVESSSMGRLFDAVSAFLDICHYNGYEGEAAIELENLAAAAENIYPLTIACRREDVSEEAEACRAGASDNERWASRLGGWIGDTESLFLGMLEALESGVKKEEIARGFIYAVADFISRVTECICQTDRKVPEDVTGKVTDVPVGRECVGDSENVRGASTRQVVLSGGTFQNRILLERTIGLLEEKGYLVYINEKVPCGDGGICLGQAYLSEFER